MSDSDWRTFDLRDLVEKQLASGQPYEEFLRVPSLSCGIYRLDKGAEDLQAPHDEDEVYYVIAGKARLRVGDEDREVGPGMVLYVRATSEHSFFEVEEDLTVMVFFASGGPSEG